ncbi:hypothetical protein HZH66_012445 [Vespula vulgaris]|uniref:Uncharacterized protein n=1 Tax=Vespula vulgaris TaxID=7454 RepID=A0A834MT21_VESVU|nr:hypothetical protein HZH66_012445 [Vespula vulgaris]
MAAVAGIYGFSEERHTRYSDLRQHHTGDDNDDDDDENNNNNNNDVVIMIIITTMVLTITIHSLTIGYRKISTTLLEMGRKTVTAESTATHRWLCSTSRCGLVFR